LLFRFSALTADVHRIHYDEPYATGVEGFPGLVVHGPLLAVYLAELGSPQWPDDRAVRFEFQLRRPVFAGDVFRVQGTLLTTGSPRAWRWLSGVATSHVTAMARYA